MLHKYDSSTSMGIRYLNEPNYREDVLIKLYSDCPDFHAYHQHEVYTLITFTQLQQSNSTRHYFGSLRTVEGPYPRLGLD